MNPKNSDQPQIEFGVAGAPSDQSPADRALESLAALARITSLGGDRFCANCVRLLASAYGVAYAYIAVFPDESRTTLHTLAYGAQGEPAENFSFDLAGTPCADVLVHDRLFIPSGASGVYPKARWLTEHAIAGYYGAALKAASGERFGALIVADRLPMVKDVWVHPVLGLYADRIAFELGRQRLDREMQLAASVFRHSPQGIMITDSVHRIRKVNAAFTAFSGWQEHEVTVRRDRILSAGRDDPGLLDEKQAKTLGPKLETLLEQLREVIAEGHKALVFSQFTSLLAIVRHHLDEAGIVYEYLDGRTRKRLSLIHI